MICVYRLKMIVYIKMNVYFISSELNVVSNSIQYGFVDASGVMLMAV